MTTEHPITPPPELVQQWMRVNNMDIAPFHLAQALATQAARWGADQELEACCWWLRTNKGACFSSFVERELLDARRPKPPSLAEQALDAQERMWIGSSTHDDRELIRAALERLQELKKGNE